MGFVVPFVRQLSLLSTLAAILSLAGALPAQEEPRPKLNLQELGIGGLGGPGGVGNADPATFSASFQVQKGSRRGTLSVTAIIEPGWHVFSVTQPSGGPMPSRIKVPESDQYKLLGPFQPDRPPHTKPPDVFKVNSEEHEEQVTWSAPIELAEGVTPETLEILANYSGQVCKESCIPLGKKLVAKFAGYTKTPGEYRPDTRAAQVVISAHLEPAAVMPGGKAKLMITATPNKGWHVYAYEQTDPDKVAKPTLIYLPRLPGWGFSSVQESVPPVTDGKTRHHSDPVTWTMDITVPAKAELSEKLLTGYVGIQTCKDGGGCLPPHAVKFRVSLPVEREARPGKIPLEFVKLETKRPAADGSRSTTGVTVVGDVHGYDDLARLLAASQPKYSLPVVIGFGLLGGLILNLMPCVLPVIGLKVLSFAQQGGQSRGRIFALNLWFAAGLMLVFLLLATAAAFGSLLFGENLAWGQQFTYTEFKVAMVVIVFAFALSFLGVWEVPIPGFAQSGASSKLQQQEGISGAFFKGVFTTLLATPCSGPFLGPVFAYTLAQPPLVTYLIFGSVGLGMASPYVVIGAFPALVRWLPKPGEWMEVVKQLMGFVLLGTTVYLFATINHEYFIPTLALVMGVWFGCWWIGKVPVYEPVGKQVWAWVGGCAAAAAIGYTAFAFLAPVKHLYEWKPYSPESIAKLQAEGKTVMVDFTADWCLTCQYNFRWAINTQRVKDVVEKNGVAPLLADWTDQNETIAQKLAELNSNSIPFLVVYPASRPGEAIVLHDVITEKQLIEALEKAGPSKSAGKASAASSEVAKGNQPAG